VQTRFSHDDQQGLQAGENNPSWQRTGQLVSNRFIKLEAGSTALGRSRHCRHAGLPDAGEILVRRYFQISHRALRLDSVCLFYYFKSELIDPHCRRIAGFDAVFDKRLQQYLHVIGQERQFLMQLV
jgi:hypothetical protein